MIVWLCYDQTRADGRVWAVRSGRTWLTGTTVESRGVTWQTVYRPDGPQPRAYLRAESASVAQHGDAIVVSISSPSPCSLSNP